VILSAFPPETLSARWLDKQEFNEEEAE